MLIDAGLVAGAHGAIPGISNVVAADCVAVYNAARQGDWVTAERHTQRTLVIIGFDDQGNFIQVKPPFDPQASS